MIVATSTRYSTPADCWAGRWHRIRGLLANDQHRIGHRRAHIGWLTSPEKHHQGPERCRPSPEKCRPNPTKMSPDRQKCPTKRRKCVLPDRTSIRSWFEGVGGCCLPSNNHLDSLGIHRLRGWSSSNVRPRPSYFGFPFGGIGHTACSLHCLIEIRLPGVRAGDQESAKIPNSVPRW